MIGQLTGIASRFNISSVIVQVGGVGYRVFVAPKTIGKATKNNKKTDLYIYTHVREDTLDLYGFLSKEELGLFEMIIAISGIGPKTGLNLLDKGVDEITEAVKKADVDFFVQIPRLGKKNAQRLIIELKPKLGDIEALDLRADSPETNQALDALVGLGFTKKEGSRALRQIPTSLDLEAKITKALKYLGTKK